ncbi:MAG: hypothetical protein H6898_02070 [Rhodobacter sp.]|nr:hypothetical protein [Paracoccaceae bacterium]MCC0075358.1 hypothetical protein [Rhodobacter sp.]
MIIIAGLVIGAVWGIVHARRNGGTGFDVAQYAAVWALIGVILATFASLGLERVF